MAKYTSMLKGTAKAIGAKAKNLAESDSVRDSVKNAYDRGTTTARCYANIAKLTVQINGELEEQQKVFNEIGRLYYELNRGIPAERFEELFAAVLEADEKIEAMREELAAAKSAVDAARTGELSGKNE